MGIKALTFTAIACAILSSVCLPAQAIDTVILKDSQGQPFIELRFFSTNDGRFTPDGLPPEVSPWDLSAEQKSLILAGLNYWANVIKVVPGQTPAVINAGTMTDVNANAQSPLIHDGQVGLTMVQAVIQNLGSAKSSEEVQGIIRIGTLPWDTAPFIPS